MATPSPNAVIPASQQPVASVASSDDSPTPLRAAPVEALLSRTKPFPLKRAPSLSELVQTMRTQNPDKWEKLKSMDAANSPTNSNGGIAGSSSLAPPNTSNNSTPSSGTSPGGDGPRLRLPARLAAQAPLLSRSHSSNAIVQSSPGSSLPASLPIHLSSSPARGGLPSLEAIEKRFASKIQDNIATAAALNASKVATAQSGRKMSLDVTSSAMARSKSDGNAPSPTAAAALPLSKPVAITESKETAASVASSSSTKKPEDVPTVKTPTSATSSSTLSDEVKAQEHPLEHNWTLYYDSRATAKAAQAAAALAKSKATSTPISATHPSGTGTTSAFQHANYEAGLSTIGTFSSVQSFCRLYNWTKRPSRMGMNENLHLFKDGIMPMWEDERNMNGGKWTFQIDTQRREDVDRFWTWLCLAMVGEDFEDNNEEICGAVMSTRPRFFRIQVWVRNKDEIVSVNSIGKRLIRLLDLDEPASTSSNSSSPVPTPTSATFGGAGAHKSSPLNPNAGISLDFSYHSKGSPPSKTFISIVPTPSSTSHPHAAVSAGGPGSAFASFGVSGTPGNKILTPTSTFNRPPGLGVPNGSGGPHHMGNMTRAASMGALSGFGGKGGFQAAAAQAAAAAAQSGGKDQNTPPTQSGGGGGGGGAMNWRERLGQQPKKPLAA